MDLNKGTRAYPIAEVFERLGIGYTKGTELVSSGELKTYTIGRFRYATEEAVREFIQRRIEESAKEFPTRAKKVAKAMAARQASRRKK